MDWPSDRYHKNVLSSWSTEAVGTVLAAASISTPAPATMTASLVKFVPFSLAGPYLVRKIWWANGTAVAGNMDCGVFAWDGTLLFSTGSTVQAIVSSVQSVNITDVLLLPGSYYMAIVGSSATGTLWNAGANIRDTNAMGLATQASTFPLPATATFATSTASVPLFGITSGTVV